jgi:transcription-repair coupling factor (superfamily II helicase)
VEAAPAPSDNAPDDALNEALGWALDEALGPAALALAARARAGRAVVRIMADDGRAADMAALLRFFAPEAAVAVLPAWDCLPYDRVGPHADIVAARVAALSMLLDWRARASGPRVLLTSANAALQRLPPPEVMAAARLRVEVGGALDTEALHAFCAQCGYARVATVRAPGEVAQRGGILDLFPPGLNEPARIDLFGDTVESIRAFDPATQVSGEALPTLELRAAAEAFVDTASIARFRAGWHARFGPGAGEPLYDAVSEGRAFAGAEHWLPLFYDHMAGLADYLPGAEVQMEPGAHAAAQGRLAQIADFYTARTEMHSPSYRPLPPEALYLTAREWESLCEMHGAGDAERVSISPAPRVAKNASDPFAALRDTLAAHQNKRALITAYTPGALERLTGMVAHAAGLEHIHICATADDLAPGRVGAAVLPLDTGFATDDLCVLTERDILGHRISRPPRRRAAKPAAAFAELSTLAPGDLVVHTDHGVGRFVALETLTVGRAAHDCLRLEYAGGDRLFVPVANMDLLTRYGGGDGAALDKLGGAGWQARKAAARRNVMEIAGELMARQAARQDSGAQPLSVPADDLAAFAARFPYAETDDQARAIADVLADMHGPQPMDRLICGDVGFGKTEVAMRAAFVAAKAGAQVAVIVPTTLLARQHFETFTARFKTTGLRVGQLSRMVPPGEAKRTKAGLADGSVPIVIGTHALLSDTIRFANLGLVVVDEEQHFGVKQKEKLKALRTDVHVLALSATPIPRTLHMALSAVRAMSVIATPPVDRLAIRSFVAPLDPVVMREALMREHRRGGQSFVVCPRVKDLPKMAQRLADMVPDLTVIQAHGQMKPTDLEARIGAFYDGRGDILLATPIIESGLDVPRANTLIIHRADMFGMAQLYQIRGRVGRSSARAYAYLTYEGALTPPARKRLSVMERLDSLGAGFELASHDLDIRGAGNILGADQSGHVREVGMELYQTMLADALAALRAGQGEVPAQESWSPQIKLGVTALLPEGYVADVGVRMGLYRRLSDAADAGEREALAAELADRFGPLPPEARALLEVLEVKALARACGLAAVEAGGGGALLTFHAEHTPADPMRVARWAQGVGAKLRPDGKIAAAGAWPLSQRAGAVAEVLRGLARTLAPGPKGG